MTIAELIAALEQIEDKSKEIAIFYDSAVRDTISTVEFEPDEDCYYVKGEY